MSIQEPFQFVCCAILSDGVWLLTELIRFYRNHTSMREEVDNMCKLTTLWLEVCYILAVDRGYFRAEALSTS